jgi:hypothetical protein
MGEVLQGDGAPRFQVQPNAQVPPDGDADPGAGMADGDIHRAAFEEGTAARLCPPAIQRRRRGQAQGAEAVPQQ